MKPSLESKKTDDIKDNDDKNLLKHPEEHEQPCTIPTVLESHPSSADKPPSPRLEYVQVVDESTDVKGKKKVKLKDPTICVSETKKSHTSCVSENPSVPAENVTSHTSALWTPLQPTAKSSTMPSAQMLAIDTRSESVIYTQPSGVQKTAIDTYVPGSVVCQVDDSCLPVSGSSDLYSFGNSFDNGNSKDENLYTDDEVLKDDEGNSRKRSEPVEYNRDVRNEFKEEVPDKSLNV